MTKLLRIGIIGLGWRWQKRYRPALLELPDLFAIRALCDEVYQRAINEAYSLSCDAAAGPTQLLENKQVDAVLMLDPQWYHLWPVQVACGIGKPVLCCPSADLDETHVDEIHRRVQERQLPVMVEMPLRFAPAMKRLQELLDTRLGPARLLLGEVVQPEHGTRRLISEEPNHGFANPLGRSGIELLEACAALLGGDPETVLASGPDDDSLSTLYLDFGKGKAAQVTRWQAPAARRELRLRVIAERGWATVVPPGRLQWKDAEGRHSHSLREQSPATEEVLRRFHEAVTENQAVHPSFADGHRILQWLRIALQSRREGRTLPLT